MSISYCRCGHTKGAHVKSDKYNPSDHFTAGCRLCGPCSAYRAGDKAWTVKEESLAKEIVKVDKSIFNFMGMPVTFSDNVPVGDVYMIGEDKAITNSKTLGMMNSSIQSHQVIDEVQKISFNDIQVGLGAMTDVYTTPISQETMYAASAIQFESTDEQWLRDRVDEIRVKGRLRAA